MNITDSEKFKVPRDVYKSDFIPGELEKHFSDVETISEAAKSMTAYVYTKWTNPDDDIARNGMLVDYLTDSRMFSSKEA